MELNRCSRCGAFFASTSNICPNCEHREANDMAKLKSYFAENEIPTTMEELANNTGISSDNLNMYLKNEEFGEISKKFDIKL